MLEAETCSSASYEGVLPGIGNSNVGNVKKVYASELVANTVQLVAVTDRTTNARKMCTAIIAGTGCTKDRTDLERPRGQVQGRGKAIAIKRGGKQALSYSPREPPNQSSDCEATQFRLARIVPYVFSLE